MSSVGETLYFYHLKYGIQKKVWVYVKLRWAFLDLNLIPDKTMFSGVVMSLLFHIESKSPLSASLVNAAAG